MVLAHDVLHPSIDPRVYKEASSLVDAGYQVTVVCRMSKPDWPSSEKKDGISIVRVLCPHPPLETSRIIRLKHNRKNSRKVAEKIIELKPDVIHCHDLNTLAEGVRARNKLKVPLIYDSHEDWPLLELAKSNSKIVYNMSKSYEKRLLKKVTHRIVATPAQSRLLTPENSMILLNCPSRHFMDDADPVRIIKEHKLQNKTVITYHGVIGEKKGILELIDVAEELTKRFNNLVFLVIGDGYEPFVESIEEKGLTKYFIFTGRIQYSEIPSYLKASDIDFSVLRPTKQYRISIPTKIFEGMQAGIPFLGNAEFPSLQEIIKKYKAGLLVNSELKEITGALESLIKDENLRSKLGKNGELAIKKEYNWEKQAEMFLEFYEKIFS